MTWTDIRRGILRKEVGCLICIVLIAGFGIGDEIFGRVRDPLLFIEKFDTICQTVVSIQATVATLAIAILSLIAGRIDIEYLGVKHIDFLLNIKPCIFKQSTILFSELSLVILNVFLLMSGCYNILIAIFIISMILVAVSIYEIYGAFSGTENIDAEIHAYISSFEIQDGMKSNSGRKDDISRIRILENLSRQWKGIIDTQSESQYQEYLKAFDSLFAAAFNSDKCREFVLAQCVAISRILFTAHSDDTAIRGIDFVHSCYQQEWFCIRDRKEDQSDSDITFYLFEEIYDDMMSAFAETDIRKIEKNFRWWIFADLIIQNALLTKGSLHNNPDYTENAEELNPLNIGDIKAISDFCFFIGSNISGRSEINKEAWGYPLRLHWRSPLSFPDTDKDLSRMVERAVTDCYFSFMVAQVRKGYYDLLRDYWYQGFASDVYRGLTDDFAYLALKLHCYIYYLAFYETDRCVDQSIIDAAGAFIRDSSTRSAFDCFLAYLSQHDRNTSPGSVGIDIFHDSLDLQLLNDLRSYEFYNVNGTAKRMLMDDVTQDFVTFLACYIGNYIHNYAALDAVISERRSPSFYIRYERDGYEKQTEALKQFFLLMEADNEVVQLPADGDDISGRNTSRDDNIESRARSAYNSLIDIIEEKYKNYSIHDAQNGEKISSDEYEAQKSRASAGLIEYLNKSFGNLISHDIREDRDTAGYIFSKNGYSRFTILRFSVFSDDDIEKLIRTHYEYVYTALVNSLANRLTNAKYAVRIRKDKYTDDQWMKFLRNNKDMIVVGSTYPLYPDDYGRYEDVRKWLNDTEHYTNGAYGVTIFLKKDSVKLDFRNVKIDIHPESIVEAMGDRQPDHMTGKYRYAPSSDMPVNFTEDELSLYLKNKRRIVNVSIEAGVEIDPNEDGNVGYVVEKK